MTKIICTINAACVTQDYFAEHGSVVIACTGTPIISERVPRCIDELKKILIKINRLIMNHKICEVSMNIELDEFSHDCLQKFQVRNYIEKIKSPSRWMIKCKYFMAGKKSAISNFYYDPLESY